MAKQKKNVVLMGRNEEKLKKLDFHFIILFYFILFSLTFLFFLFFLFFFLFPSMIISCQKEIETQFKVQVKYIVADFSSADPNLYSRIETELDHLDVGILVNFSFFLFLFFFLLEKKNAS